MSSRSQCFIPDSFIATSRGEGHLTVDPVVILAGGSAHVNQSVLCQTPTAHTSPLSEQQPRHVRCPIAPAGVRRLAGANGHFGAMGAGLEEVEVGGAAVGAMSWKPATLLRQIIKDA